MKNFKLWLEAKKMVLWDDETKQPVHPDEVKNYKHLDYDAIRDLQPVDHGHEEGHYIHKDEFQQHKANAKQLRQQQEKVDADRQRQEHSANLKKYSSPEYLKYVIANINNTPLDKMVYLPKGQLPWEFIPNPVRILEAVPKFHEIANRMKAVEKEGSYHDEQGSYGVTIQIRPKMSPIGFANLIELLGSAHIFNDDSDTADSKDQSIEMTDPYDV